MLIFKKMIIKINNSLQNKIELIFLMKESDNVWTQLNKKLIKNWVLLTEKIIVIEAIGPQQSYLKLPFHGFGNVLINFNNYKQNTLQLNSFLNLLFIYNKLSITNFILNVWVRKKIHLEWMSLAHGLFFFIY